jgi:hypothetical protein
MNILQYNIRTSSGSFLFIYFHLQIQKSVLDFSCHGSKADQFTKESHDIQHIIVSILLLQKFYNSNEVLRVQYMSEVLSGG